MEFNEDVSVITDRVLAEHQEAHQLKNFTRVLFKTSNSMLWQSHPQAFQMDYVGLDTSGAIFLSNLNLSLVGVDYLSIAAYHDTHQPHQILLSKEIVLLEGINLSGINPGVYHLLCAPLLIEGCEGAPARVFLVA
jgi:arylformamidase